MSRVVTLKTSLFFPCSTTLTGVPQKKQSLLKLKVFSAERRLEWEILASGVWAASLFAWAILLGLQWILRQYWRTCCPGTVQIVLSLRSKLALLTLALPFSPSVTIAESGPWSSGSLQIMQLAFPSITD